MEEPVKCKSIFTWASKQRRDIVDAIAMGETPAFPTDFSCAWNAGLTDVPAIYHRTGEMTPGVTDTILYEDAVDPMVCSGFQCDQCSRMAKLIGNIHPWQPMRLFDIGKRRFRLKYDAIEVGEKVRATSTCIASPLAIQDILVQYWIQNKFPGTTEEILYGYRCGRGMVSIRARIPHLVDFNPDAEFTRSAFFSSLRTLIRLRPYRFVYGNVMRDSLVVGEEPIQGSIGCYKFQSMFRVLLRDFSYSSLMDGRILEPQAPGMDMVLLHSQAGFDLYDETFEVRGNYFALDRARHRHFDERLNFALNVYTVLCALVSSPGIRETMDEDVEKLWISLWPEGPEQARRMEEKLRGCKRRDPILRYLSGERLYQEPILKA